MVACTRCQLRVVIPGEPIALARPRAFIRGNGIGFYDSQSRDKRQVSDWMERSLRACFDSENKEIVIDASNLSCAESIHVKAVFTLPVPRNRNRSEINAILWGLAKPNTKPDLDNYIKFYLDAGNGILWRDDCVITSITAKKRYGDQPRTVIDIMIPSKNLNKQANEIIEEFNPDEVMQLAEGSHELANLIMALKQEDNPDCSEEYCKRVKTIAITLSRLADKYSRSLTRIHKKYPGFWQNEP